LNIDDDVTRLISGIFHPF